MNRPAELHHRAGRRARVGEGAVRVHADVQRGRLTITLVGASQVVSLAVASPALRTSAAISSRLRGSRSKTLSLTLSTTDAGGVRATFGVRIKAR